MPLMEGTEQFSLPIRLNVRNQLLPSSSHFDRIFFNTIVIEYDVAYKSGTEGLALLELK